MNHIEIEINNYGLASDQDVLRVVRDAMNGAIKYDDDRKLNYYHNWNDSKRGVEISFILE